MTIQIKSEEVTRLCGSLLTQTSLFDFARIVPSFSTNLTNKTHRFVH